MADKSENKQGNGWMVLKLAGASVLMFGFGFAMVPLYDVFCEVTGIRDVNNRGAAEQPVALEVDTSRTVTLEMTANRTRGGWSFEPEESRMEIHPGKLYTAHYLATNGSAQPRIGHAVPSVAPVSAGRYLKKIECFCFNEQQFAGEETKRMPVLFYLDPELPENIGTITLAYSFFAREQLSEQ